MTDDDRRAEIEAVAKVLMALPEPTMAAAEPYTVARAMIAALDRVRDARGDDEAAEFRDGLTRALNRHGVPAMPSWDAAIDWLAEHGSSSGRIGSQGPAATSSVRIRERSKAARSPQDEDHEELIRNLLVAWLNGWEPGENQDLIDLAEKVLK
jgi:hypothetical protein